MFNKNVLLKKNCVTVLTSKECVIAIKLLSSWAPQSCIKTLEVPLYARKPASKSSPNYKIQNVFLHHVVELSAAVGFVSIFVSIGTSQFNWFELWPGHAWVLLAGCSFSPRYLTLFSCSFFLILFTSFHIYHNCDTLLLVSHTVCGWLACSCLSVPQELRTLGVWGLFYAVRSFW